MANADEQFMQWLQDAHAMEEQAITMLEGLLSRIETYPSMRGQIAHHLEETRDQARRVEECIRRRGGDTSSVKDLFGKAVAIGQTFSGLFAGDEIIKSAMAAYTFEHMEIAAYCVLSAAAENIGDKETVIVLNGILEEEIIAANQLEKSLPNLTVNYLGRLDLSAIPAKR